MTETDATARPLSMPEKFIPYLEKHRLYVMFKDMLRDLIVDQPTDHLKFMKVYLNRHRHCTKDADRIILLVSPSLNIDIRHVAAPTPIIINDVFFFDCSGLIVPALRTTQFAGLGFHLNYLGPASSPPQCILHYIHKEDIKRLVKDLIKDLGLFAITRRIVMDRYVKHDDYVAGCVSPALMSEVTKFLTLKEPVPIVGWLMFDHPCTVPEARCLQQDGVLPTVTLALTPTPLVAPPADNPHTPSRNFFEQDFEGLKFVYKATLKEVYIDPDEDIVKISSKCVNAITAAAAGLQGPKQGYHVVGAPGLYKVLIIGPRGSGRHTQAVALARHFGLVFLNFEDLFNEALEKSDVVGNKLRQYGVTMQLKAEIVERRLMMKDCLDHGWVLTGYPTSGADFEKLDGMPTPPNRVIFLNTDIETCKKRIMSQGVDWCTGQPAAAGSGERVRHHPRNYEQQLDSELDTYFWETLAEMRAAAGLNAVEINANDSIDEVQVRVQAAVIAAPAFDIEYCSQIRNASGE